MGKSKAKLSELKEQKPRKNPIPDVIMKISDLELIISKMKSLGVQDFRLNMSKGKDPEQSNVFFEFFSNERVSFVHYRDYNGSGIASITHETQDLSYENEVLREKRSLLAYIDDEDTYQY